VSEFELLREISSTQPFLKFMGIEIIEAGPGWVRERLAVRPQFLQPRVVHGGAIYALADTVAAHSVLTRIYPSEWVTTVEQKINYLRPAIEGELIGYAQVLHFGKRIVYSEAEVKDSAGKLIARSTATLMRLPPL
jgi:acyl-CoA thioesterase